ncbi:MAG: TetR family transcriptional regulator [Thiohalocapsa sp.]
MAKGEGRSPRVSGAAAASPAAERDRIIDSALVLIARDGWRGLAMGPIAVEAGLPILSVYREFRAKPAILAAFFRRIDEAVLMHPADAGAAAEAAETAEADERPRDRVFDLLMRRLDALQPYRGALKVLGRELPADPPTALCAGARLLNSMAWMLEAAGIAITGWRGVVAVKLTSVAYLSTLRVWLRDESPDLGPTMAHLDRRLRGIEGWLGSGRQRRRGVAAGAGA